MNFNDFPVKADRFDSRDLSAFFDKNQPVRPVVDLRPFASAVEDQLHLGSCVGQAIVGAYELMINKLYPKQFIDLSRLFVYYNARLMDGSQDQDVGAYVRDGIKSINKFGVCSELIWPYLIERFADAPSVDSYVDAKNRLLKKYYRVNGLEDMISALNAGYPVVISMAVYSSFYEMDYPGAETMPMPTEMDEFLGGHAMTLVGYDLNKKLLLVRNSFGDDWAMNGYCWMPFDFVKDHIWDSWIFDIELISPNIII